MIKFIFGWVAGTADLFVVLIIIILVGNAFSNFIYQRIYNLTNLYIKLRTFILKQVLKIYPNSAYLQDLYKRSYLHNYICSMQNFLIYLTEKYGGFEICPMCNLPHKPNVFNCPYCKHTDESKFNKVKDFLLKDV
jgi:hypothetical protein